MRHTTIVRSSIIALGLGLIATQATRADEVVQFTNGAEMTVQSHVVTKDMVKLDLGGNNSISFPLTMVNKIVSSGQDVFRNPTYYPANQAIAGGASGGGGTQSFSGTQSPFASGRVQKLPPGQAGMRLGEAADGFQASDNYGSGVQSVRQNPHDDMSIAARPHLDPMRPLPNGGVATIDPPNGHPTTGRNAPQMSPRNIPPPAANPPQPTPSPGEAAPPAEPPANDDNGNDPQPNQDPPPNR